MVSVEEDCLIAFGANQGEPEAMLQRVLLELGWRGFRECRASGLYRTRPIGGPAVQAEYANAVIRARIAGSPDEAIARLLEIELACGRERTVRWAPRTVDLDLLLFGLRQVDEPGLSLPHPRMLSRRFVLEPACEVAAELRHPWSGASLGELAAAIGRSAPYLAVWLWPNFAGDAPQRWRTIGAELAAAGVRSAEFLAAGALPVPLELPNVPRSDSARAADSARAGSGANAASGNWHILVVSDPLQLNMLPQRPGLMIGWKGRAASPASAAESAERRAVQQSAGATVMLDHDRDEAGRELAAALTAAAEFWREPVWPKQGADSAAPINVGKTPRVDQA